jgi:hypothetical protein
VRDGQGGEKREREAEATFYNNVAAGLTVAGGLVPYLAVLQLFPDLAADPPDKWFTTAGKFGLGILAATVALQVAMNFRRIAQSLIVTLDD